ncbi:MAG: hypothetical protein C4536_10585 [Actinobacteria bacterium]|jgi:hypothetical protein|nr:MAG: hypothetical protein C4536_10585 [Actinomycetota bacterium]
MAFKAAFIAHAPDADPAQHRAVIATPKYELFVSVVRDQGQAVEECRRLVAEEGIHAVMLCPGFTHEDVAGIAEAVGEDVGVNVARGDGPSTRIAMETIIREWT